MDNGTVKDKYWIKNGMAVRHKGWPEQKMYVMSVNKEVKEVPEDTVKKEVVQVLKTFTINVKTHWLDKNFTYQQGEFHTTELEPWSENAG